MAARTGLSKSTIGRIWRRFDHRAQQRVDVNEHPLIGAGQQIDPLTQLREVTAQHRLQLPGVPESELPQ